MSRFGYDGYDDLQALLAYGRWEARVKAVLKGRPAQPFLRELETVLLAMPERRLIASRLVDDDFGDVSGAALASAPTCALGEMLVQRYEREGFARAEAVRHVLQNAIDPDNALEAAEFAKRVTGMTVTLAELIQWVNDEECAGMTAEARWQAVLDWTRRHIRTEARSNA